MIRRIAFFLCLSIGFLSALAAAPATPPATRPVGVTARNTVNLGPDTVLLNKMQNEYQAVPFAHRLHSHTGEGCTTCHHRNPTVTRGPGSLQDQPDQTKSNTIPACKSCHPASLQDAGLRIPTLEAAYHRQCLSCHEEWANSKSCTICHEPMDQEGVAAIPTLGQVTRRIPTPATRPSVVVKKITAAPGTTVNAVFRHAEHVSSFGLTCVNCHAGESCSDCHNANVQQRDAKLFDASATTWKDAHGPCADCHAQDRCRTCHYTDGQPQPAAFNHAQAGLALDGRHMRFACSQCHPVLTAKPQINCSNGGCHRGGMNYPARVPGNRIQRPTTLTPATFPATIPLKDQLLQRLKTE